MKPPALGVGAKSVDSEGDNVKRTAIAIVLSVVLVSAFQLPAYAACSFTDHIHGSSGIDHCDGTSNADLMHGHEGDDNFFAGDGGDQMHGGSGDDTFSGQAGQDVVGGDSGDDWLFGNRYDDDVKDQGSNQSDYDELYDGYGNDTIRMDDGDGRDKWHNCPDGQAEKLITRDSGDIIVDNSSCDGS